MGKIYPETYPDLMVISEGIQNAGQISLKENRTLILNVDLGLGLFWVEEYLEGIDEPDPQEIIPYTETSLIFTGAQNSTEEISSGVISFLFYPDGSKEFGLIHITEPYSSERYTIFLNPYGSNPEIMEGTVTFDEEDIY